LKLEAPNRNQRFNEIAEKVSEYLEKLGYNLDKVKFVPTWGFDGDNLVDKSDKFGWYDGLCLYDLVLGLRVPKKLVNKPLRIPIQKVFKIGGVGTVPIGIVETGILKEKLKILIQPRGLQAECNTIEFYHTSISEARAGYYIGLHARGISVRDIGRSFVIGDPDDNPPWEVESFEAQIIILNHPGKIKKGYSPIMLIHTAYVSWQFIKLIALVDRRTGKAPTRVVPEFQ
jgi:elongation factor 1-alpha